MYHHVYFTVWIGCLGYHERLTSVRCLQAPASGDKQKLIAGNVTELTLVANRVVAISTFASIKYLSVPQEQLARTKPSLTALAPPSPGTSVGFNLEQFRVPRDCMQETTPIRNNFI